MRYGGREVLHGIDLVVPHGWWWASWARTGPARPPPWRSWRAIGAAPPGRRGAGHGPGQRRAWAAGADRHRAAGDRPQPGPDRARDRRQFAGYYRRPRAGDEVVGLVGLEEAADGGSGTVGRAAPAPGRRAGPGRRPRAGLPRRADHRLRPGRPPAGLAGDRRPARPGQDGPADHPLHGRGAGAGRPGGDHRRRPDRGRGHARPTWPPPSAAPRSASPSRRRRPDRAAAGLRRGRPEAATSTSRPTTRPTICSPSPAGRPAGAPTWTA